MKAEHISIASRLEDMPNIGPAVASLLRDAGIHEPTDMAGQDALWLYDKICQITRQTHSTQLLDRLLSAVDFADGHSPKKLEEFVAKRNALINDSGRGS